MTNLDTRPEKEDLVRHWKSWGMRALPHLSQMMGTEGWSDFDAQIAQLFYACPFPESADAKKEMLTRVANQAAPPPQEAPGTANNLNMHVWTAAIHTPEILHTLLSHPNPEARVDAAAALLRHDQAISAQVQLVLEAFQASTELQDWRRALSLLRAAPIPDEARIQALQERIETEVTRQRSELEKRIQAGSGPSIIAGIVVDPTNQPLENLNVTFLVTQLDNTIETGASRLEGRTNQEGRFSIATEAIGWATLQFVRVERLYRFGYSSEHTQEECKLIEEIAPIELLPGSRSEDLKLIVEIPEITVLSGTITDEQGNGLKPSPSLILGNTSTEYPHGTNAFGQFCFYALPAQPFLLELTLAGYQTLILEVAPDFKRNDRALHLVLRSEAYPDDSPLWTVVTGKPWTQEAVDNTIGGKYIRRRLETYRQLKSEPTPARNISPTPGPLPELTVQTVN